MKQHGCKGPILRASKLFIVKTQIRCHESHVYGNSTEQSYCVSDIVMLRYWTNHLCAFKESFTPTFLSACERLGCLGSRVIASNIETCKRSFYVWAMCDAAIPVCVYQPSPSMTCVSMIPVSSETNPKIYSVPKGAPSLGFQSRAFKSLRVVLSNLLRCAGHRAQGSSENRRPNHKAPGGTNLACMPGHREPWMTSLRARCVFCYTLLTHCFFI